MSHPHTLRDAKARLSELLDRAAQGEEVEIVRSGAKPGRFRLLAVEVGVPVRVPGALRGAFAMPEDFDAPDPQVAALFEDRDEGDEDDGASPDDGPTGIRSGAA